VAQSFIGDPSELSLKKKGNSELKKKLCVDEMAQIKLQIHLSGKIAT
jgi:hypothetical protein